MNPPASLNDFSFQVGAAGARVIAPSRGSGYYASVLVVPDNRVFTNQEIRVIKEQKTPLYFFGVTDYSDIFGKKHFTRFCGVYTYDTSQPAALKFCDEKDFNYMN